MNSQVGIALVLSAAFVLTACGKKSEEPVNQQAASAPVATVNTSADQQASIDALDKPVLDEKTDTQHASEPKQTH